MVAADIERQLVVGGVTLERAPLEIERLNDGISSAYPFMSFPNETWRDRPLHDGSSATRRKLLIRNSRTDVLAAGDFCRLIAVTLLLRFRSPMRCILLRFIVERRRPRASQRRMLALCSH